MKKNILIFFIFLFLCTISINAAILKNSIGAEECLCTLGASAVTKATHKITLAQAKALVMAALTPEERRAPGVTIDTHGKDPNNISTYKDHDNSRFLIFNVVWAAKIGSDNIGLYSVDIYTGDVFSDVSQCAEYYSKKLAVLQKKIRHSLHLTDAQYQKFKTNGPQCIDDTSDKK
jgi:hypothetical protein